MPAMRSLRFPVLLLAAVTSSPAVSGEVATMFTLTSSAFASGQQIPKKYTCAGDDRSPPLAWTGAPSATRSFALIIDDPDAPDPEAPRMTWVHWVLYNIPATATMLGEGSSSDALPAGAVEGPNDFGRVRYGGPCPPIGRHRYFHKLYALDTSLPAGKPLDKAGLESAMKGHVLAHVELMGTYQKGDK
jgi:Raf kinase inhibitor-like YbhB/YbcL family protein